MALAALLGLFSIEMNSYPDNEGMNNKKLLILPTLILSSMLLLTACTSGNPDDVKDSSSKPSVTSTSSPSTGSSSEILLEGEPEPINMGYVAPPEELENQYRDYYSAPSTISDRAWAYYKEVGAKTHIEDSAERSLSVDEYNSLKKNLDDLQDFDKVYGEINSDIDQTALKVSKHLEKNPDSTVEEINSNPDLIINRYVNLGSLSVEKDNSTGFYFVIFDREESEYSELGILVPQEGLTPDFNHGMSEGDIVQE